MVAKSASFGHGSLVCGLWLAGGGRGGSVPTYVLGTFYIRFFCTRATISLFRVKPTIVSRVSYHHNLGLGTNYVFLHVGWVQNLNLFLVVFLLVSTRATWDSGTKY